MAKAQRQMDFMLRVLVLSRDRELVARLREVLFAAGDVDLLRSATTPAELLAQAEAQQPDLVLLDTDRLGSEAEPLFAALRGLGDRLAVVAVTATPNRAPRGHHTLLRPPTAEATFALLSTLRPDARRALAPHPPERQDAAGRSPGSPYLRRLLVRSSGTVRILPVEEILWIDAIHNAVKLHASQGEFRLRQSIAALAAELDPVRFARIHRSTVVRLDAVREFVVNARGQYSAVMPGGARLTVSRSFHQDLLARLRAT